MDVTDHWMEFLEQRMLVIRAARFEGKNVDQISNLVGVGPMQIQLLCKEADKRNAEAKGINTSRLTGKES